jgi:hypothetical protein
VTTPSGLVAASGLALPVLARETKKTGTDEAISPPEDLMREHAILDPYGQKIEQAERITHLLDSTRLPTIWR